MQVQEEENWLTPEIQKSLCSQVLYLWLLVFMTSLLISELCAW
jgi:hypothetical protein